MRDDQADNEAEPVDVDEGDRGFGAKLLLILMPPAVLLTILRHCS